PGIPPARLPRALRDAGKRTLLGKTAIGEICYRTVVVSYKKLWKLLIDKEMSGFRVMEKKEMVRRWASMFKT
ncbi:MAG: hypothetical protein Q4E56_01580, partial [Pseudomonadota bacterium]|nr:hypothetical protein [Pseudomonadota bacterium]